MTITVHHSFLAEKQYIIQVLLGEYLGLEYELRTGQEDHYTIEFDNGKKLVIVDDFFRFFNEKEGYLHEDNIPNPIYKMTHEFAPVEDMPVLFGGGVVHFREDKIIADVDIFASAFFMLTRWEEYVLNERDQHDRFPAEASLASLFDFLHRPVVNEYIEFLWNLIEFLSPYEKRKERQFSTLLTHDVDHPYLWEKPSAGLKTIAGDLLKRKNTKAAQQHLDYLRKGKDPFDTFDTLMDLSEQYDLTSHFFFIAGGKTKYEGNYDVKDGRIQKLMSTIDKRGHKIGIHPSYDIYKDKEKLQSEISHLQSVSPQPVESGRQHFLRFSVPHTWQAWEDAGLKWDCTMGYAEHVGFRCGTCYPFPVFNVQTRQRLQLIEHPLHVMEVSLFSEKYMNLDQEKALKWIQYIIETIQLYDGEFVLLWHNSNLVLDGEDYWKTYQQVLECCS